MTKKPVTEPTQAADSASAPLSKPLDILKQTISNCLKGDRAAQNALYHALADKMYGVCLRYGRSRQEAEEILQEGLASRMAKFGLNDTESFI